MRRLRAVPPVRRPAGIRQLRSDENVGIRQPESYMRELDGEKAANSEGIKMQWQPIETAPKDGKMVIGFFSPLESPFRPFQKDGDMAVIWYAGKERGWVMPGVMGLSPTFWVPLPEPPQ